MSGDIPTDEHTTGSSGQLRRELTLLALVATAVCTVIGGGINVLTVEIQQKIPGIAGMVPWAFALGVVPAVFAALCYGVVSSAMPRAGGDYVYISR
ncbi:MAG: amino acid transporter, partial [Armatimonadota bacterium]